MAQGKKDRRPKDPVVPLHIANAAGLNDAQKKAFAASADLKTSIPRDRVAPVKRRKGGRGSSGEPAKRASAKKATNGRRNRASKKAPAVSAPASSASE